MPKPIHDSIIDKHAPLPVRPLWQRLLAVCLIGGILFAGVSFSKHLMATRPKAGRNPPARMQTLVETVRIAPSSSNVHISAYGNVMPAQQITVQARVSGEVVYVHPNLVPGGIIEQGETIIRLDDLDYKLALRQKQNDLAKARADLRLEQGNQTVAKKEWQLINDFSKDIDQASKDLALRQPQLAKAESSLEAAATAVAKAELDLERTVIKAPFKAVIREKKISIGSQITPQTAIATLAAIDTFWAELSLPMNKVSWIDLPSTAGQGSSVTVYSDLQHPYPGTIITLLPDLDTEGLMARLLIGIDDPMGLQGSAPSSPSLPPLPPLPLGSFIRAEIIGRELPHIFKIPRAALQDGDKLLTVKDGGTLHIAPVSVLWADAEWAYINEGISAATAIVVSNVPAPIEGMPLAEKSLDADKLAHNHQP